MQELPSANSAATVAISDSRAASEIDAVSDQQAAPAAEHHAELLPHPNLQHEAIGNVQPTCAMTSQKPLSADRLRLRPLAAFSGLKRSASMPTLPTAQMVGQLPSSIFAAQLVDGVGQKASAMHRGDAELKAAAPLRSTGHQMTGQTALAAQILGAVEPNDVNAAHSMPIAVPGHWVTAASVGATAMDSSMSNSPKESTASIAIANPFAVRTNTDHLHGTKTAIAVPQSYLYTEAALRNSITSSAGNRHSSLFAHHEKENSPKPKPSHVTMPDSAPVLHETVTTLAASGKEQIGTEPAHSMSAGNSAMSGTASELALSAKHYRSGGSQIQAYSTISGDVVRVLQDPGMLQDAEGLQHAGDAANKRCRLY